MRCYQQLAAVFAGIALCACGRVGFDADHSNEPVLASQTVAEDDESQPDPIDGSSSDAVDGSQPDPVDGSQPDPVDGSDTGTDSGECESGFENYPTCTDIDECAEFSPCAAEAVCDNLPGTFSCACPAGFSGDGFTCTDIDDCATAICDVNASCVDGVGTFECVCDAPFVGDGATCSTCGNGVCDMGEGCESCASDCGQCRADCVGESCAVTGFTLIDTDTLNSRGALSDEQVLDLDELPGGVGILFNVEPEIVGSVSFSVDGLLFTTESEAPYAVHTNDISSEGGLEYLLPMPIGPGNYTFRASPFGAAGGGGAAGRLFEQQHTVTGTFRAHQLGRTGERYMRNDLFENGGVTEDESDSINLGADYSSFRFASIILNSDIPVTSAVVQFHADASSGTEPCSVRMHLAEDTSQIRGSELISERTKRNPLVDWDIPEFTAGQVYSSVDVTGLAQEYIDSLPSGTVFASFLFLVERTSSACARSVQSVDVDFEGSARLVMEFDD